jgi:hypothetical protein
MDPLLSAIIFPHGDEEIDLSEVPPDVVGEFFRAQREAQLEGRTHRAELGYQTELPRDRRNGEK